MMCHSVEFVVYIGLCDLYISDVRNKMMTMKKVNDSRTAVWM